MPNLDNEEEFKPAPGEYNVSTSITTGPVVLQYSKDNKATWKTFTDGSIATAGDSDRTIKLNGVWWFRAQIPSGDECSIESTESGAA